MNELIFNLEPGDIENKIELHNMFLWISLSDMTNTGTESGVRHGVIKC